MHTGFFDVLHDAADDHVSAVGQRVDIDFGGFFQELVDQHRARGAHQRCLRHVFLHGVDVVGDHHGAATEHVAGANQHGQSDFSGDTRGFFRNKRGAIARLRNFQLIQQGARSGDDLPQGRSIPERCR